MITQPASHPWLHSCGVCGIHRMNAQPGKKQDCLLAPNRKHGQPAHSHGDTREKGGHLFGDTTLNKESRRAANQNTGRGCLDWQAILQRQTWGLGRDIEVDHTWRLLPSWTSETRVASSRKGLNPLQATEELRVWSVYREAVWCLKLSRYGYRNNGTAAHRATT